MLLSEGPHHGVHMKRLLGASRASGNLAHDAHIAALVVENGAEELWTCDGDFSRFDEIRSRNPFVQG